MNVLAFMPLAAKLNDLLKAGVGYITAASHSVTVEQVATFIEAISADWNPSVDGQTFLDDPETRRAGARFLAGIAIRMAQGRPQTSQQRGG